MLENLLLVDLGNSRIELKVAREVGEVLLIVISKVHLAIGDILNLTNVILDLGFEGPVVNLVQVEVDEVMIELIDRTLNVVKVHRFRRVLIH